ncbi:hypothetical protein SprV_0301262500 [Sparganum proliferum]
MEHRLDSSGMRLRLQPRRRPEATDQWLGDRPLTSFQHLFTALPLCPSLSLSLLSILLYSLTPRSNVPRITASPPPRQSFVSNAAEGHKATRVSPLTLAASDVRSILDNPSTNRPERRTALVARELARYKVDIVALSEIRFSEQGRQEEAGAGYTFFLVAALS